MAKRRPRRCGSMYWRSCSPRISDCDPAPLAARAYSGPGHPACPTRFPAVRAISARRSSRGTEPEDRPNGQNQQSDGPAGDHPDFLDRKGRTPRHLHLSPDRSLRRRNLSPVSRGGGGRRFARSLRLGIVSRGQDHRIHRIGTGIATAPSRRRRPLSLIGGVARVPPRGNLIGVTSARARRWRRADRQIRSAFGTLCLFPGVPIFRLECPPAGADDSYHGSLSWEQSAPLIQPVMGARLQSNVVL